MTINWTVPLADRRLIDEIVDRAKALDPTLDATNVMMDITACHANGNPLDLQQLAAFPDFDFMHDVFGINRHIDHDTGKLQDCFVPRCTARKER